MLDLLFQSFDPQKKSLLLAGLSELMQQNYEDQIEALKVQIEHLQNQNSVRICHDPVSVKRNRKRYLQLIQKSSMTIGISTSKRHRFYDLNWKPFSFESEKSSHKKWSEDERAKFK